MSCVLGIDVGGTKVAVAAVEGGEARHAVERPTVLSSPEGLLEGIEAAVLEVSAEAGEPQAIGIGVPSQIEFATGTVLSSVNIPLAGVPLRQELVLRLRAPVYVDHDANCAALADAHLVADAPGSHLAMVTLGTGAGAGVIIDGRIFRGASGLGGELGHVVIDGDGRGEQPEGRFPRPGSLEWFCSGRGLEREATRRAFDYAEGRLGRLNAERGRLYGPHAVSLAQVGDEGAVELFGWLGR